MSDEVFTKLLEHLSGQEGHPDYFNESGFLRVTVNGEEKRVYRGWLEGSGRGANSALSHMILGTEGGLSGCCDLVISPDMAPQFDGVLFWLATGTLCETMHRGRSIKLHDLANYFGLDQMMETIRLLRWPTKNRGTTVSVDNIGCVTRMAPGSNGVGFGFILDKATRKQYWFSAGSVNTVEGEEGIRFGVGTECRFDIVIAGKGKKPNEPKATRIRAVDNQPFNEVQFDGWY